MESGMRHELDILGKHVIVTTDAIASCASVHKFADRLMEEEFISSELRNHLLDSVVLTDHDRSRRLVEAVRSQVNLKPSKFQTFVVILEEEPSLKSLADRLKLDYDAQAQGLPCSLQTNGSCPTSDFSPSILEHKWALLLTALVEILSCYEKALERMKTALEQLVLSKPASKSAAERRKVFAPVVASPEYKEAKGVRDFFRILAPHWNWVECSLLHFVIEASTCKEAGKILQEFLQFRSSAAPLVVLQTSEAQAQQPQTSEAISSQPLPTSSGESPRDCEQAVVVKVNRETLTLKDYDEAASALSRAMSIPRYIQRFFCTGTGSIAIEWRIPAPLLPYLLRVRITNSSLKALAKLRVFQVTIGPIIHLNVASMAYWKGKPDIKQRKDFFRACKEGNLDEVLECLRSGVFVDTRERDGWTPLMMAAHLGHREFVEVLLEHNADINAYQKDLWTPLMFACYCGHAEVVLLLLGKGADANARECDEWTPLMLASQNGHIEVVLVLLEHGAVVNAHAKGGNNALIVASISGHTEVVQSLLDQAADLNYQREDGCTPLMLASKGGHTNTVQALLNQSADVNRRNDVGWTALTLASRGGYTEIVELLLYHFANVNAQMKGGWSSLIVASKYGHMAVVQVLLDHQADVNAANMNGMTALDIASATEQPEIYELLALNGATHGATSQSQPDLDPGPTAPQERFGQFFQRLERESESDISDLLYRAPALRHHSDQGSYDPTAGSNIHEQGQH